MKTYETITTAKDYKARTQAKCDFLSRLQYWLDDNETMINEYKDKIENNFKEWNEENPEERVLFEEWLEKYASWTIKNYEESVGNYEEQQKLIAKVFNAVVGGKI